MLCSVCELDIFAQRVETQHVFSYQLPVQGYRKNNLNAFLLQQTQPRRCACRTRQYQAHVAGNTHSYSKWCTRALLSSEQLVVLPTDQVVLTCV